MLQIIVRHGAVFLLDRRLPDEAQGGLDWSGGDWMQGYDYTVIAFRAGKTAEIHGFRDISFECAPQVAGHLFQVANWVTEV